MGHGAALAGIDIQYCMTLPRELLQSVETTSVTRVRASEDYLLAEVRSYTLDVSSYASDNKYFSFKDQWRMGITSLMVEALGLRPFKDVFWTSSSNPGNNYYYDCMEVDLPANPNVPWPLNYRYVGPINVTGHLLLSKTH